MMTHKMKLNNVSKGAYRSENSETRYRYDGDIYMLKGVIMTLF